MTDFNPEEIDHLANLSRLTLSDDEKKEFSKQLPLILNFVDQLKKADIEKPEHKGTSQNDLREDEAGSDSLSLIQLEALVAPNWQDDQVMVPPVFGESGNE